jgi:hypothetical protein
MYKPMQRKNNPPLTQEQVLQMWIAARSNRSWRLKLRPLEQTRSSLTYLQRRIPRQSMLDKRRNPFREPTLAIQRLKIRQLP